MGTKHLVALGLLFIVVLGAAAEPVILNGLSAPVDVTYDDHSVPHIFASTWVDAARVLGYLHATDRLWHMDMNRRVASGTLAEILGKDSLKADILVRQLGIRRTCQQLLESDLCPEAFRNELDAYCAGVNARIAELSPDGLPPQFQTLSYAPAPWEPVDCLVFLKYMGWDQAGTDDDLWFGMLVEKLGAETVNELWPLDRPYEIPAVKQQVNREVKTMFASARMEPVPGAAAAYEAAMDALKGTFNHHTGAFGSNNWAVSGSKTRSGKPILCSDPHLGFSLPSIWYTCHLSAEGRNLAGVSFPGSPSIVIGHNDHLGWGITNMQSDQVDYFVETVDPNVPQKYLHRGEWKTMERVTENIPVKGEDAYTLNIDSTVHGPIVSRDEKTIAMQWTGLGVTTDGPAIWGMGRATNLDEWLDALDYLVTPCLNLVYADSEDNIALHPCGVLPLRTPGQGRVPLDGASGDNDWVGMIPRGKLPLAVNPDEGFVVSANGRPASIGYPFYLGYQWDPSCRVRRINDMLRSATDLTIETMAPIQNDSHDKFAETFLPVFLQVMERSEFADPFAYKVLAVVSQWDYVADPDSIGTIVWMRWMDAYRKGVWADEWSSRGIDMPGGSWGFSGDNRREPMLEVLEYITREMPGSVWFDDRTTTEREGRNEIIERAFTQALAGLRNDFGDDLTRWAWKNFNVLKIRSMTGISELARTGGPVPGDAFTVNPGSEGGGVGGGASWRMIVDFGDTTASVGVYPGGQHEDPNSPHYDDQMAVWSAGEYLPLHSVGSMESLPDMAKARTQQFQPKG
jgi:penicillin amidase